MEWIDAKLEEYKIIRSEIINFQKIQYTLISFGVTIFGVLAGFGLTKINESNLFVFIFLFAIPMTSNIILFLWTGVVRRTLRNASYCYIIEKEISKVIKSPKKQSWPLNWENWVNKLNNKQKTKKKNNQEKLDYFLVFGLFLLFNLISLIYGTYMFWEEIKWYIDFNTILIYSICFFFISILFFFFRGLEIMRNYG